MIYFDNSATTKINEEALQTYLKVSKKYFGNPSSLHELGESTSRLLIQSRKQIAEILNVSNEEIYFTSGGTEGDNWAIKGTAYEKENFGQHLITTSIEHPAVMESMKELESRGWEVTYLPVNEKGHISIQDLKEAIRPDTVLVSIMAVNNEIGAVQPLKEIGKVLENYPSIHFHVDAVQAVGKVDLSLGKDNRIDIAVFSGHKFHAPRGVGFVYIKNGKQLKPLLSGGGQESGIRSGTENLPAVAAMAKALRLLFDNKERKVNNMKKIKDYIQKNLEEKENVTVFSPKNGSPHILCFGIKNIRGEVTVHAFEKESLYLSTTSACSSRSGEESSTLMAMDIPKSVAETAVRISLDDANTLEEAEEFVQLFDKVYNQFENIQ